MIKIYKMNISGIDIDDENIYSGLSEKRLSKVRDLKKDSAKKQSIGAELLLNAAVRAEFADCKTPVLWDTDENGKLYLCDYPNLFVNLSHSGEYSVCAVSDGPVGVDIQHICSVNLKLAERFFTKSECEFIKASQNFCEEFYKIWVKKESLIKAVGRGLAIPLNSFCVLGSETEYEGVKYKFYESGFDDYKLCVCKRKDTFERCLKND